MGKDVTIGIPRGMTPEQVAKTFTAYLIGSLAFGNRDSNHGPFEMTGSHDTWQLDGTNDFWLHDLGEGRVNVRCRYEREIPIIEAATALFIARYCR